MKKAFPLILVLSLILTTCSDPSGSGSNGNGNGNGNGNDITNPSTGLADFLAGLKTTAQSGGNYSYEVKVNETIAPHDLTFGSESNITITLKGDNTNRIISLASNGSMFTVRQGVTLILDNNITLQGLSTNNASLVVAHSGGTLIMNAGSKISDNTNTIANGGGVVVSTDVLTFTGGNFIMNGGEISGNRATNGGGVAVSAYSAFTMKSGKITGNTASGASPSIGGGGVLAYGNFTMENGEISNNTVSNVSFNTSFAYGGGVHVAQANFLMSGGKIIGNTVSASSSLSSATGGGVNVVGTTGFPASFTMTGGEISGNEVSASAVFCGGGVYVNHESTNNISNTFFTKTSGIITGYADDATNGNVVKNNSSAVQNNLGHAVFISSSKRKESTVGSAENLDSGVSW